MPSISIPSILRTISLQIASVLFIASVLHQNTQTMDPTSLKLRRTGSQLSPISLPQAYHQLRPDLLPEIIHHIFSLQLKESGIDLAQLKSEVQKSGYKDSYSYEFGDYLAGCINRLIKSCGYNLGPALFKWLFPDAKISVRDVKNKIGWKAWRFEVGKICIVQEENTYRDIHISLYSLQ